MNCLAVLPDGSLASASSDDTVRLWNKDGKDGICTHTLEGHTQAVYCMAVLRDGSLASGSKDRAIKLWKDGVCTHTLEGFSFSV